MAQHLDPATRDALVERVRFYRDLGLTEFYRRPVDPALLAADDRGRRAEERHATQLAEVQISQVSGRPSSGGSADSSPQAVSRSASRLPPPFLPADRAAALK